MLLDNKNHQSLIWLAYIILSYR